MFRELGVTLHKEERGPGIVKTLGMEGVAGEDPARRPHQVLFQGADAKFWEILLGTEHLIKYPYATGREVMSLMGSGT